MHLGARKAPDLEVSEVIVFGVICGSSLDIVESVIRDRPGRSSSLRNGESATLLQVGEDCFVNIVLAESGCGVTLMRAKRWHSSKPADGKR